MKFHIVDAGNFMCDGGALFGVVPKMMWQKYYPCNNQNYCNLSLRCLLVELDDRKILIETGVGNKHSEKFLSHNYLFGDRSLIGALCEIGIDPNEITDVVLTHLHFDHCGGCVQRNESGELQLVFPNAVHWVGETQWHNFLNPNLRERGVYFADNMMPVFESGNLRTISKNTYIAPGFELRIYNGHTVGQIIPFVACGNRQLIYMSDLIPVAASVPVLWIAAYDVDPLTTIAEKESFLAEAAAQKHVLFFEHDFYTQCCTVGQTSGGYHVDATFDLSDLMLHVS